MPVVMQIKNVRIKAGMEHEWSKATYDRVADWLGNWTCAANFKACFEDTREEALEHCRQMLREHLVPTWFAGKVLPNHFEFQVSWQEAEGNEFWMPSVLIWGQWHEITEKK